MHDRPPSRPSGPAAAALRPRSGGPDLALAARRLACRLPLDAPLVFLDVEATGLDPASDRVVELCCIRVEPGGAVDVLDTLVDPGVAIPPEATAVHGIEAADVAGAPRFEALVEPFLALVTGAALGGYNLGRYDLPLLAAEVERQGRPFAWRQHRILDVSVIFRRMEPRSLAGALRFYCGDEHVAAHSAAGDVGATMAVLGGQLDRYPELPRDLQALDAFTRPLEPEAD